MKPNFVARYGLWIALAFLLLLCGLAYCIPYTQQISARIADARGGQDDPGIELLLPENTDRSMLAETELSITLPSQEPVSLSGKRTIRYISPDSGISLLAGLHFSGTDDAGMASRLKPGSTVLLSSKQRLAAYFFQKLRSKTQQ